MGRHWEGWLSIGAEQWVVDVLRDGYRIPFSAPPPLTLVYRDHRAYAPGSRKFRALQDELLQLLAKGAIEEAPPSPGFYSHLFVVPKVTGGFRPIIDLSALNRFVATTKFKMETIRTVMAAVRQGDWMVSLDLQDAYLQVPVHPDSRRFLRFTWGSSAWQFRVLCFGLSTAPQVFTRIMAPVSAEFHRRGFRLLRYLDDWLLLAASEGQARAATSCLLSLCVQLGIRVNWKKSSLRPEQEKIFLGMRILSPLLKVFPTQERLRTICDLLLAFLARPAPPARQWLRLLGHMSSLIHLVPGSRRRMRLLQIQLHRSWSRHSMTDSFPVSWDAAIRRDLDWWLDTRNLEAGQPLQLASPDLCLYTDASEVGWGASLLQDSTSGLWNDYEKLLHINVLELRAIRLGLCHFVEIVQGAVVAVFSDNTTALAYLNKEGGTRSPLLNAEARAILDWAEAHSVRLLTQFVRGVDNVVADGLSRRHQVLSTEWTLHQDVCRQLWRVWGSPTVDLFATSLNFRLPLYVSPFQDPQAIATDAFLFRWDDQDLYAFPPFPLVRRVLNKLRASRNSTLILIAPYWPQKEWFPDLLEASLEPPRLLPLRRDLLCQPHARRFHRNLRGLRLTAWRLSSGS